MKHNNTYVFNRLSHTLLVISILTAFTLQVKAQNPIELMNAELRHADNTLESRFEIDLSKSSVPAGMYIIQVSTKNEVLRKKFVVQP